MSRLASVVLTGPASTVTLPVGDAKPTDLYILQGVDGLGSPDIDVAIGQSVYRGGVFQGSFARDRELVFLISFNPDYASSAPKSIAELRAIFYTLISGPDPITMTFYNKPSPSGDYVPDAVTIKGHVRRVETVPFVKNPQVQVTVICPSPYLEALNFINVPFTPNTPSLEPFNFSYDGTAIVGFEFNFEIKASTSKIVVKSVANNGVAETISIPGSRVSGEIFNVNTNPTDRQVYWTQPSISTNYGDITGMCSVTPDRWPSIHPGQNVIQVLNDSNLPLNIVTNRLRYTAKYWGV